MGLDDDGGPHGNGSDSTEAGGAARRLRAARNSVTALFGAEKLWAAGFRGAGVRMGVFDTGIRADHPHVKNIRRAACCTSWSTDVSGKATEGSCIRIGLFPDHDICVARVWHVTPVAGTRQLRDHPASHQAHGLLSARATKCAAAQGVHEMDARALAGRG